VVLISEAATASIISPAQGAQQLCSNKLDSPLGVSNLGLLYFSAFKLSFMLTF
ncbi:uncharacterized protein METZ01_LOCUS95269, partial [marine metagenome]